MKACQILALLVLVQHLVDSYYVHRGRLVANNGHTVYTVSDATHIKRPVRRTGTALLFSLTGSAPSSGPSADNPASHNRHRNVNQYRTNGERLLQMERILSYCKGETDGLKAMPTLTEINHAITTAGRHHRADDALRIFKAIHQLGYTPDLMSFNNIIWSMGNTNRTDAALRIFQELSHSQNLQPNVYTYGALLHGFAKSRGYQQAIYYLDEMTHRGLVPNQIVISSVMEACSGAGKYREALEVMHRMDALGLEPDVAMINTAVKACCVAGALEEAEQLAQSLRARGAMDVLTFHTLMMGHAKLGRHPRVLELYAEAVQTNISLDDGIFSLAMLSAFNVQQYSQVKVVADRARSVGVRLTEASYTTLIQAYGELGEADQAVRCLSTMRQEGLAPNEITYSAIMCACRSLPAVVCDLLQRMRRENIQPNTVVLTNAIDALARGGSDYIDRAFALYQDMEKHGPEPNIFTYNTITRAFAEAGKLEEALSILKNIDKRRLKPDIYTFTTLLMACGRTNGSDAVDTVMSLMKKAGVTPDLIAFGAALDAHRRAGNSLKAVAVLGEMRAQGLEPTASHYNLVIRTLKAEGHVDKMFKMVMTLSVKIGVKLNSNTFELVIETLLQHNKWKEALLLIRTMDALGYKPSIGVCVVLVEMLERAKEYKAVLALYNYMEQKSYDFSENAAVNGVFQRLAKGAIGGANTSLSTLLGEADAGDRMMDTSSDSRLTAVPTNRMYYE